jgi:hypothetical protein
MAIVLRLGTVHALMYISVVVYCIQALIVYVSLLYQCYNAFYMCVLAPYNTSLT